MAWLYHRTKSATRFPEQVQLPAAAALAALASPAGLDQWGGMQHSGMNIAAMVYVPGERLKPEQCCSHHKRCRPRTGSLPPHPNGTRRCVPRWLWRLLALRRGIWWRRSGVAGCTSPASMWLSTGGTG